MALWKEVDTKFNIKAGFWSLNYVITDKFAKQAYLMMYLFINKEHSDAAKEKKATYIDKIELNIYPDKFDKYFSPEVLKQYENNTYRSGYIAFKENCELFSDAEDVLEDEVSTNDETGI